MNIEELNKLTPEEKRVKIREACGWKHEPRFDGDTSGYWVRGEHRIITEEMPNELDDLNAVHEAEKSILTTKEKWDDYEALLAHRMGDSPWNGLPYLFHAEAPQRVDTLLLVLP